MDFQDDEPLTIHAEDNFPLEAQSGSSFETPLLLAAGAGACALALALAFGPRFSPEVAEIGTKLGNLGFSNGAILTAGVLLFGLGLVIRRRSMPITVSIPDRRGSIDLVLDALPGQIEAVSMNVAALDQRLTDSIERAESAPTTEPVDYEELIESIAKRQNGALFRLAASLDQLGQRLEKHFDSRIRELATHMATAQVTTGPVETAQGISSDTSTPTTPVETPAEAPVAFDETTSLGVLDAIDEPGEVHAVPQPIHVPAETAPPTAQSAPQPVQTPNSYEPVSAAVPPPAGPTTAPTVTPIDSPAAQPITDPPACLPTGSHVPMPGSVGIEGSSEDLESLLPDYRVREAIDDDRVAR